MLEHGLPEEAAWVSNFVAALLHETPRPFATLPMPYHRPAIAFGITGGRHSVGAYRWKRPNNQSALRVEWAVDHVTDEGRLEVDGDLREFASESAPQLAAEINAAILDATP